MKGKKWYQKISNWLFIVALLILIPILITNISIMFQANSEKDKVPNIFGYKPFIVLSGSMETEIKVGDLIITKMTDPKTLKKDDVIAFRDHENTVTTHRIIDIIDKDGKKYFVTKGDNNDSQDENLVEYEDVEGIYITRIPGVGNIFDELAKPTTIIILFLGVTVIFVLLFQISNKKLKKQQEEEILEYKNKQKEDFQGKNEEKSIKNKENHEKYEEKPTTIEENHEKEFLEYKKMKEQQEKLKEEQEFLEFKRMKEEQERKEFLEYKKMMEEKKNNSNQQSFSQNNNTNKKHNHNNKNNKNAKRNHAHNQKNNKKHR